MKKIFDGLKAFIKRYTSPVALAGLVSIIGLIVGVAGIHIETITTWKALFDSIIMIISNPFILGSIAVQLIAIANNPTDKKHF